MGEHKRNPIAIAAKKGELPPKKPKISKAERDRYIYAKCQEFIYQSLGLSFENIQKKVRSDGKIY